MDYPTRKSSRKIFEVVRQFQIIGKWKKIPPSDTGSLRRASSLPLDEKVSSVVPKGSFVVSVGEGLKRFVLPTRFLAHPLFGELLREAEEEFGFQQKGVLRIPCDVFVFEHVLRMMKGKKKKEEEEEEDRDYDYDSVSVSSPDCEADAASEHRS